MGTCIGWQIILFLMSAARTNCDAGLDVVTPGLRLSLYTLTSAPLAAAAWQFG